MSMQESKWHRPCTHKEQTPISIIAVQDFTRHLMGASSAALCSAFCFVLQGDASRLDGFKADHWGASGTPNEKSYRELPVSI
jgi:hypothetical protein